MTEKLHDCDVCGLVPFVCIHLAPVGNPLEIRYPATGRIIVPGDPYGKRAPQVAKLGKLVRIHPHKEDKKYAKRINEALSAGGWDPITEKRAPLWVNITAHFERPGTHILSDGESLSSEGRQWIEPTKKPDFDNISKIVCDTFTHAGVWPDDAQVTRGVIEKVWSPIGKAMVVVEWGIRSSRA